MNKQQLHVLPLVLNSRTLDRRWLLTIVLDSPSLKLFLSTQVAKTPPFKTQAGSANGVESRTNEGRVYNCYLLI
ncbi:hypothetical protein Hanom_Chr16g01431601 [Helianthus anomalus]